MAKKYVISFESTHGAIAARRVLDKSGMIRTIPVPRAISAACGIAISFEEENLDYVMNQMKTLDIEGEYELHILEE